MLGGVQTVNGLVVSIRITDEIKMITYIKVVTLKYHVKSLKNYKKSCKVGLIFMLYFKPRKKEDL